MHNLENVKMNNASNNTMEKKVGSFVMQGFSVFTIASFDPKKQESVEVGFEFVTEMDGKKYSGSENE